MKKPLKLPPPLVALLTGILMWAVDRVAPTPGIALPAQNLFALLVFGGGLWLSVTAFMTFRKAGTTVNPVNPEKASMVVRHGVFSKSRNPMYLSLAIMLGAVLLWLGSALNIVVLGGFIWLITNFQIKPEEAALASLFGEEYKAYKRDVRRWI